MPIDPNVIELMNNEAERQAFFDWYYNTHGMAYLTGQPLEWWDSPEYKDWVLQGRPTGTETTEQTTNGQLPDPESWEAVVFLANQGDLDSSYAYCSYYHPDRILEWVWTYGMNPVVEGGPTWIELQPFDDANNAFLMPDGTLIDMSQGYPIQIKTSEEGIQPAETITASDGTPIAYVDQNGQIRNLQDLPISDAQLQQMLNTYESNLATNNTDPTQVPQIQNTPGFEWYWDGNRWAERKVAGEDELTNPAQVPSIPNTPGYEWAWDGNRWYEKKTDEEVQPQSEMPTEQPPEGYVWDWTPDTGWYLRPGTLETQPGPQEPYPSETPPEGYIWQYDPTSGQWYLTPGTLETIPGPQAPYPSETPPAGYIWNYDPDSGEWYLTPGALPGQEPISPLEEAQLDLQRQELLIYAQNLKYQAQVEQDRIKLDYAQYLAGLAANPASFMEYAVASGQAAAVQPWMPGLDFSGQLQPGQALPGWGPSPTGSPLQLTPIPDFDIDFIDIPTNNGAAPTVPTTEPPGTNSIFTPTYPVPITLPVSEINPPVSTLPPGESKPWSMI